MAEICEYKTPRSELLDCPPCTEFFFNRVSRVQFGPVSIVITRRYKYEKCFLGLGVSNHVHSLTLLPGEETEIEVVRRSKYSRALHEQRSVESEFRLDVERTSQSEWSRERESNFRVSASSGFSIFGIGAKTSAAYSRRERTAQNHFREIVQKSSVKTSQKYEVAIDTKSQVENLYRSVRRVANPNPCQPVTYNYYQLAKKYKGTLILTGIRFDFIPGTVDVLDRPQGTLAIEADEPYVQNLDLQIVSPPPAWTLREIAKAPSPVLSHVLPSTPQRIASLSTVSFAGNAAAASPTRRVDIFELTREELIEKLQAAQLNDEVLSAFDKELSVFLEDDINVLGVKDSYEYCINTDGLFVETNVSTCSACEKTDLLMEELEIEKMKVEIELMRMQLERGDPDR